MKKKITTLLLLIVATIAQAQTSEARNSFFEQFVAEVKLKKDSYSKILIHEQPILWDTTGDFYHSYLSRPDTTNMDDINIKHLPTRKKVVKFMKLVDDEDYVTFRKQIKTQSSDDFRFPLEIVGNKKSKDLLTISLSQPLVSADQKLIVIQQKQTSDSGGFSATNVYILQDNKWVISDTLSKIQSPVY